MKNQVSEFLVWLIFETYKIWADGWLIGMDIGGSSHRISSLRFSDPIGIIQFEGKHVKQGTSNNANKQHTIDYGA